MSTVAVQGKRTFALSKVVKRAAVYLENVGLHHQIKDLPATYPQHKSELSQIDMVPRAKILKAHLEDTFAQNVFSVKVTRRKDHSIINIIHDLLRSEMMAEIVQLYAEDTTEIRLNTFVYNTCE